MCPPSDASSSRTAASADAHEFSLEERIVLLRLAHQSIVAALEQWDLPLIPPMAHLAEPRGAFTTLYYRGALRGCVGFVFPTASLYRTIAESARGAAFDDSRFPPVTREEASQLGVSLSVLSTPEPIKAEEIEIGRHGLLITHGVHRGLLLPQVAVEHRWDRITFLEQTCRKAGLPLNAWQTGAQLEVFTTEAFGDRDVHP